MAGRSTIPVHTMTDAFDRGCRDGDRKYGPDTWRARDPKVDIAACMRHLSYTVVHPYAGDESGQLHIDHALARLAIAVANLRERYE